MLYSVLADTVLVLHLLFILFVVLGALLVFIRRWVIWLHLPAVIWVVLLELNQWICPLTPLENQLRALGMEEGYEGDFIGEYLIPIIYPPGLTPEIQWLLGVGVIGVNGVLYGLVGWRWQHKKRARKES